MTIQAEPLSAIIDGITLTPGGHGTEINGKSMSLERGGILIACASRLVIPSAQAPPSSVLNLDGMAIPIRVFRRPR